MTSRYERKVVEVDSKTELRETLEDSALDNFHWVGSLEWMDSVFLVFEREVIS